MIVLKRFNRNPFKQGILTTYTMQLAYGRKFEKLASIAFPAIYTSSCRQPFAIDNRYHHV